MMKIQGSTRCETVAESHIMDRRQIQDRKLVWSMEENDQQGSGLPREFTFVFLVEQPRNGEKEDRNAFRPLTLGIQIKPCVTGFGLSMIDHHTQLTEIVGEVGQKFPSDMASAPSGGDDFITQKTSNGTMSTQLMEIDGSLNPQEKNGLYNFAAMPGSFEDLVEMPGTAASTVEPSLPDGK
jgi:hypothetical protein